MPIYEYKCTKCENIFSKLESISSEEKVKDCPECGSNSNRIMSQTSFKLKGDGWFDSGYTKASSVCESKKESSPACASCPAAS